MCTEITRRLIAESKLWRSLSQLKNLFVRNLFLTRTLEIFLKFFKPENKCLNHSDLPLGKKKKRTKSLNLPEQLTLKNNGQKIKKIKGTFSDLYLFCMYVVMLSGSAMHIDLFIVQKSC